MGKTITRTVFTAATLLACGLNASAADYTISLDVFENASKVDSIALTDLAEKLGVDTATVANTEALFAIKDALGELSTTYTANGMGFWMLADGTPINWGTEGFAWYCEPSIDANANQVYFWVGNNADNVEAGKTYTTTFYANLGGKQSTIDVNMTVKARPVFTIDWDNMNQTPVKTIDLELSEKESSNGLKTISFDLDEICKALGVTDVESFAQTEPMSVIFIADSVAGTYTNESTANNGFWMDDEGKRVKWGNGHYWFVEQATMDYENNALTFVVGQNSAVTAYNEEQPYFATTLYVANGTSMVALNIKLNIEKNESADIENMQVVYEQDFTYTKTYDNSYKATLCKFDAETVATALGLTVDELAGISDNLYGYSMLGELVTQYTANAPGFWMKQDGSITNWGGDSWMFIEYHPANAEFSVGQHPDFMKNPGDTFTSTIFLVNGNKAAKFTFNISIEEQQVVEIEKVGTVTINQDALYVSDYTNTTCDINIDAIAKLMGDDVANASSWEVFIVQKDVNGADSLVNSYTCTPNPGFWMNAEGVNTGWGSNAKFGLTFDQLANGTYDIYQMPGQAAVGDVDKTTIALVSKEGKAVYVNFTINLVETLVPTEYVDTVTTNVSFNNEATKEIELPIEEIAAKLGFDANDETAYANLKMGVFENGVVDYTSRDDEGFHFDLNGLVAEDKIGTEDIFSIYYATEEDADPDYTKLIINNYTPLNENDRLTTTLYFTYTTAESKKVYVMNLIVGEPVGINAVETVEQKSEKTYDLNGRAVNANNLKKGIYIQKGQKMLKK